MKPFQSQHLPPIGKFVTTKAAVIEQCTRAMDAAKHGGFVAIRGYPVFIKNVEVTTDIHGRASAVVHYERIGARPRTSLVRDVRALQRELMNSALTAVH